MNWVLKSLECWKVELEDREPKTRLSKKRMRRDQIEMISVLPLQSCHHHESKGNHYPFRLFGQTNTSGRLLEVF